MIQQHMIATILLSIILRANAFSYKDAKNWGKKYPECNGKNQSPILIIQVSDDDYRPLNETLRLTNFQALPSKMTIKNTGHTVEVRADWSGKPPRFTGGPLHGNYVFEKATFHWAQKQTEHMDEIMSKEQLAMDLQIQMFFYRTDLKSFEKAQSQKDGLAAIEVQMPILDSAPSHFFDNLEKNLHKVQSINSTAVISPFCLTSLVDDPAPYFLFHKGSLDYPPCSESVNWFLYTTPVFVTTKLVNGFEKIKLVEGDVSNIRPLQALNNRRAKVVIKHGGHYDLW